jgi:glucose uptake protein
MVIGMFCWGSWANTLKLAGKWRFEMYYFDFALGLLLFALIYAATVGNLGFDGFGFVDSILNAGKREWAFAIGAGVVFSIGTILLLAAISAAGMALSFPVALGTALIFDAIFGWATAYHTNSALMWPGCLLVLGAIVANTIGYGALTGLRHEALAKAGGAKSTRRPSVFQDIALALVSGLFLGGVLPMLRRAIFSGVGLGPYAVWGFFAAGLVGMTVLVGGVLLSISVQGEELSIAAFFQSTPKQHLLGLAGGALCCTGLVASFVGIYSNTAPGFLGGLPAGATPVNQTTMYLLRQGGTLLAALWGILVWKEEKGGNLGVRILMALTLVLYAGGMALVALSPVAGY